MTEQLGQDIKTRVTWTGSRDRLVLASQPDRSPWTRQSGKGDQDMNQGQDSRIMFRKGIFSRNFERFPRQFFSTKFLRSRKF
jgi:hypothetical protein